VTCIMVVGVTTAMVRMGSQGMMVWTSIP
jgi:hypothetical protein